MATTASLPAYMLPGVPVHQPPHLDGDASLATEILPGPPSLLSAQQSSQKRDPRKPATVYSYLPPSDPGSTYSGIMHGTLVGQELDGPRTKRSKVDKGISSRAQRASARNQLSNHERLVQSEATTPTPPAMGEGDAPMTLGNGQRLPRVVSSHDLLDATTSASASGRTRRKDKGKAREVEPLVKVKEEPKVISLYSPEPPATMVNNNEDHCSSCRSQGVLVYCDGCPRAFHMLCLDPPLDKIDDGDTRWYCPACTIRKHPPRKPPPSLLSPLIYQVEMSIPIEFQLPDDIRNFYKDVVTGPKGTYVDASELKQPRLNRLGQVEDRDAHRLRDKNGAPILCFRCGTSALPHDLTTSVHGTKRPRRSPPKTDAWKSIISCDYCSLHWHLDCIEPPLTSMPPLSRRWMCPNHVEQVLPTKRRIPKQNGAPVEINELNQFNNGNIEIIYPEAVSSIHHPARISADEVLINGRRYRVPEKIILLDFWNQLHKNDPKDKYLGSNLSSPLTSLCSLDEPEDRLSPRYPAKPEELQVAQMLLGLRVSKRVASQRSSADAKDKQTIDRAVQTLPEQQQIISSSRIGRASRTTTKRPPLQIPSNLNGIAKASALTSMDSDSPATPIALKRQKSTQMQAETSTRELRSRKATTMVMDSSLTSVSSKGSLNEALFAPSHPQPANKRSVHVKLEEQDLESSLKNGFNSDAESIPLSSLVKVPPKRGRAPRRATRRDSGDPKVHEKERRGRKRKEREEEVHGPRPGDVGKVQAANSDTIEKKDRDKAERKKGTRIPAQHGLNAGTTPSGQSGTAPQPPSSSLKIRLPRLNQINGSQATGSSS